MPPSNDEPPESSRPSAAPQNERSRSAPIVTISAVTKHFGGVRALRGVDLQIYAGEVHALLGENGAGKSTLIKILAGAQRPDGGTIRVAGEEADLASPAAALRSGIAVVFQEFSLMPALSVAENMYLTNRAHYARGQLRKPRSMHDAASKVLRLIDPLGRIDPASPVSHLSTAEQQLVEIAKALSHDVRLLILDEPTASLSLAEVQRLFEIVDRLRTNGLAILFVSHRLDEVLRISDRVSVFRDGRSVLVDAPISQFDVDTLASAMVGRAVADLYGGESAEPSEQIALAVRNLTNRPSFENVSFEVKRGEIVALAGLVGAGRTPLLRAIFGADRFTSGEVAVAGTVRAIRSPRDAAATGIAFIPEDRKTQGLMLDQPTQFNANLPALANRDTRAWLDRTRMSGVMSAMGETLGIAERHFPAAVGNLSGGNQQKVLLGKWLALAPNVLLLDEPTRGVDVGTKADIYAVIRKLAAESGTAVVIASSDLPELLGLAHRILVMNRGRIVASLARSEASEERILGLAGGADKSDALLSKAG